MAKKEQKTRKARGGRKPPIPGVKCSPKNSHTSPSKILRAKRIRQALDLRVKGLSYPKISEMMDEPMTTVFELVTDGLKQIIREPAEALREIELERIDLLLAAHFYGAANGSIDKTGVVLRIMERRSKLLGLDRPTEVDVSGTVASVNLRPSDITDKMRVRALGALIAKVRAAQQQGKDEPDG